MSKPLDGRIPVVDHPDPQHPEIVTERPEHFYKTDRWSYEEIKDLISEYRSNELPLQNVWAGDDPENPQWTVVLKFPDEATATERVQKCEERMNARSNQGQKTPT